MNDAGYDARAFAAKLFRTRSVRPVVREALCVFGAIAVALAIAAPAAARLAASDWRFVAVAICVYGGIAGLAIAGLDSHPHPRLGVANMITGFRAGLTSLIAAALIEFERLGPGGDETLAWALLSAVIVALFLDGVDGYAARHQGTASDFGERFDTEVDALMVLVLSVLAYASGKAGLFVILLGTMRYAYLAIHALLPRLSKTLAPSILRKAICVAQIVALCAVMTPKIGLPYSNAIAFAALLLLTGSFGRDLLAQARQGTGRETG